MKKTCIGIAALAALITAPAFAADMPLKAPPPPPAPACTWCGWYVGLNAGWVGSASNTITNTGTDTGIGGLGAVLALGIIPATINNSPNGFIGGGQIGYNWQQGAVVYGLEADLDGVSAKHTVTNVVTLPPLTTTFSRELDWLSTVRGRIGFTAAPNFLIYATGGVAFGESKIGLSAVDPTAGPPLSAAATTSTTSAGGTVGAGVEWMVAPHWSLKAEYLYADLGRQSATINYAYGPFTSSLTSSARDSYNIARAGVNWHF
jgi:outer membrane immunogenic protein